MGIIDKISALVSRHTAFTLLLTLALSALSLTAIVDPVTGQMRLNIDPSANRLFSENQSAKQYYDKTRQMFGSDETLIITVASDDVFTAGSINTIKRITIRIEALPAVHHVVSLANAVDIRTVDGGLDISPFSMALEDGSASPEDKKNAYWVIHSMRATWSLRQQTRLHWWCISIISPTVTISVAGYTRTLPALLKKHRVTTRSS